MKRNIVKFILILLIICPVVKAQDMATLFANMPDEYVPHLESAWRKDLIDLYNTGKPATLQNTMNGTSSLLNLTGNYLLLQSTERSTVEIKLLPLINNTNIICMITTINAPVADSRIGFFTTEWHPLSSDDLFTPVKGDWFVKEDADKSADAYKDAISRLDMELIKYNLNPDNLTLTATYTTPLYLSSEERGKVTPYIKETPKLFTWENSRFK
ncbi:DUF3256 family protein [Massilibacteroides vaginae]|uniref:DUF3256 family protein n=1 Tax=Massilibacteroides vaginae TaxID=1673718 RepID=UPI000A1CC709|nr:DUF3256 family protein [Massilibacteroides vaginae]